MKVFLTGGTGFIGQHLTKSLLARGWNVVALVRKPESPQARTLTAMGAQCVPGDVTDRESMRSGMRSADIVVHNAAWYELGISNSAHSLMHAINVSGTDNVLGLALELGIRRSVYVSSTVYYGDTGSEARDETYRRQRPYLFYYEQTKAEAHEVALRYQHHGLPLILLCPAHVVGPNDHSPYGYFQRLYVNRLMPPFAWGPNTVHSPAHVTDVAEGIALAAEKGRIGETYILAGECTNMRQIFQIWATQPGGFPVRFFVPFWLAMLMFAPMEPLQRWLGMPAFISRETVSGTRGSLSFSSSKAQGELGWTPRPARQMWADIFDEEHKLLAVRRKRDLVSRLKPVEANE
jgi:nucleoside-diphosphate-sugar epimerase